MAVVLVAGQVERVATGAGAWEVAAPAVGAWEVEEMEVAEMVSVCAVVGGRVGAEMGVEALGRPPK